MPDDDDADMEQVIATLGAAFAGKWKLGLLEVGRFTGAAKRIFARPELRHKLLRRLLGDLKRGSPYYADIIREAADKDG